MIWSLFLFVLANVLRPHPGSLTRFLLHANLCLLLAEELSAPAGCAPASRASAPGVHLLLGSTRPILELETLGVSCLGHRGHPLFLILGSSRGQACGLPGSVPPVCVVTLCHVLCGDDARVLDLMVKGSASPEKSLWLALGSGHCVAGKTYLSFH